MKSVVWFWAALAAVVTGMKLAITIADFFCHWHVGGIAFLLLMCSALVWLIDHLYRQQTSDAAITAARDKYYRR